MLSDRLCVFNPQLVESIDGSPLKSKDLFHGGERLWRWHLCVESRRGSSRAPTFHQI
jgi:hypothetical protein